MRRIWKVGAFTWFCALLMTSVASGAELNGSIHYRVRKYDSAETVSAMLFGDLKYSKKILAANPRCAGRKGALHPNCELVLVPTQPLPASLAPGCKDDFQKLCFFAAKDKPVDHCLEDRYERLSAGCQTLLRPCADAVQKFCLASMKLRSVEKIQDCLLAQPKDRVAKACIDSVRAERESKANPAR